MKCVLSTLPVVEAMMVRKFTPVHGWCGTFRDKLMWVETEQDKIEFDVEEIGVAESRMPFDEDIVDQSRGMLEFTTIAMLHLAQVSVQFAFFTSCRWRSHRWVGPEDTCNMKWPLPGESLMFIGNPYHVVIHPGGSCEVYREPSYLIRSGCDLQNDL